MLVHYFNCGLEIPALYIWSKRDSQGLIYKQSNLGVWLLSILPKVNFNRIVQLDQLWVSVVQGPKSPLYTEGSLRYVMGNRSDLYTV